MVHPALVERVGIGLEHVGIALFCGPQNDCKDNGIQRKLRVAFGRERGEEGGDAAGVRSRVGRVLIIPGRVRQILNGRTAWSSFVYFCYLIHVIVEDKR